MQIRLAVSEDVAALVVLLRRVVPLMRAAGNLQWDDTYPNAGVFERDIELGQLWVADIDGSVAAVAAVTTDQEAEYAQVGWDVEEPAVVVHRLAVISKVGGVFRGVDLPIVEHDHGGSQESLDILHALFSR